MLIPWNNIKQNKPAIFDWLVFTFSLSIGFIFPSLRDLITSPFFSNWMFGGLLLYVAGIWLKHRPLYYRLAQSGNKQIGGPAVLFLIIGHWVIMLVVVIFSEGAFRQIVQLAPLPADSTGSGISILIYICIAAFITWLAFRPGGKNRKVLSEKYLFGIELAADILLISGVAMLSFIFWEKSLFAMMLHMPLRNVGDICMLFVFLSFAYMLFYLPLSYLYLIEDHFSSQAWKRLLLIFMLILVRALFTAFSS